MTDIFLISLVVLIAIQTSYLVIKKSKGITRASKNPIFVDTSVLMDGRILHIAQTGFITNTLYIPKSVIAELQLLADGSYNHKRTIFRLGLDIVSNLQSMMSDEVVILDNRKIRGGVDDQLLALAKKYSGSICIIDYTLANVAIVEGISVLNVNDLA